MGGGFVVQKREAALGVETVHTVCIKTGEDVVCVVWEEPLAIQHGSKHLCARRRPINAATQASKNTICLQGKHTQRETNRERERQTESHTFSPPPHTHRVDDVRHLLAVMVLVVLHAHANPLDKRQDITVEPGRCQYRLCSPWIKAE